MANIQKVNRLKSTEKYANITPNQWKVAEAIAELGLPAHSRKLEKLTGVKHNTYRAWYYDNSRGYAELIQELSTKSFLGFRPQILKKIATQANITTNTSDRRLYADIAGDLKGEKQGGVTVQIQVNTGLPWTQLSNDPAEVAEIQADTSEVIDNSEDTN